MRGSGGAGSTTARGSYRTVEDTHECTVLYNSGMLNNLSSPNAEDVDKNDVKYKNVFL